MKYEIRTTAKYRRNLKKAAKRGFDMKLMQKVVDMLADGKQLPEKYCNHKLLGNYSGFMECHIQPDWLLLILNNTGTHDDLFET